MSLTIQYLISELTSMEHALCENGYINADTDLYVHYGDYAVTKIKICYSAPSGDTQYKSFQSDKESNEVYAELLEQAWTFIKGLPSPEEAARRDFLAKLGRLIDQGRELGLETDFLNPLEASMRKLSENILEHKPGSF